MPHSTYLPHKMGHATISPTGSFEAGSFQEFTLTYTAGHFGIDDTGSLKIAHRFASDMARPQFENPSAPGYTTVEASNGAVLNVEYFPKRNIRPWDKVIYVQVMQGFLREGDQIVIRFGDRRWGSPGIRLQTFCEFTFEFRVLVDAIATYHYVELPEQPWIAITPAPPVSYKAIMPTAVKPGESFRLAIKGEDRWGNPSDQCESTVRLQANLPVEGLPDTVTLSPGTFCRVIEGLRVHQTGDLVVMLLDDTGNRIGHSNPNRIVESLALRPFWGDLHGQSEETIGTNSARDFYCFARDKAFLDVCVHQGNDFQITTPFWEHLNVLSREFNQDHRFVVFPGWEWSGNTGLGGDRNVLLMKEGRPIHRSSHALVEDLSDIDSDAHSAAELFSALQGEDCVVFAHIGGRYADIRMAHDQRLERAIEVHSAWGTFEWLIQDAFEQGYRVGILANSDGHKGRPGASHPGATKFGAYGGLTCMLATELTRSGIMCALRKRHHYGTTGSRMVLDTRVFLPTPGRRYHEDPLLGPTGYDEVTEAMMGDIVGTEDCHVRFSVEALTSSPIERIEIRNGLETLATWRPFSANDLGRRIRVIWEGSEYRGRGRETVWDGFAELCNNRFLSVQPINRYNLDKHFAQVNERRLEWAALTTGGFGGFEAFLEHAQEGTLVIETALVQAEIAVQDIGLEDLMYENGGIDRRIRVFRLPDENPVTTAQFTSDLSVQKGQDDRPYVRVTTADGHMAWSSPIYLIDPV